MIIRGNCLDAPHPTKGSSSMRIDDTDIAMVAMKISIDMGHFCL